MLLKGSLKSHVDAVIRSSVEETLNGLLEAEQNCGAQRYERSADQVDSRSRHHQRKLETKAGQVTLKVPGLKRLPFESAIIERYKRREASVERLSWRCISQECLCGESRTSLRRDGARE